MTIFDDFPKFFHNLGVNFWQEEFSRLDNRTGTIIRYPNVGLESRILHYFLLSVRTKLVHVSTLTSLIIVNARLSIFEECSTTHVYSVAHMSTTSYYIRM